MTPEFIITLFRQAMYISVQIAGPILVAALAIGLIISIFQAVTQIQEMTLAIIPKIMVIMAVIFILFPWFLTKFADYMTTLFNSIPNYIGF